MSLFAYPNQRYTSQLGLALFGQDEVLAENFLLIDAAYAAGSSISVNGTLVPSPNLSSTLPAAPAGNTIVSFQFDVNGNISGYVPSSVAPILPVTKAAIASNWLNSYNAATGLFTATQPNYTDIAGTVPTPPSGSVLWSSLGNAAADLTLANAGFKTTFNQTSAVPWLWANTTVGTVGSTNASPLLELAAQYWATGAVTGTDLWTVGIAALTAGLNSPSTLTFTHTGSTGVAAVLVPQLDVGAADSGISRLGAASLAIGNGTAGDFTGQLKLSSINVTSTGTSPAAIKFGTGPFIYSDASTFIAVNDSNGLALQINGSVNQFIIYKQLIAGSAVYPITAGGTSGVGGIAIQGPGVENLGLLWTASTKTLSLLNASGTATSTWTADAGITLGVPQILLSAQAAAPTSAGTAGTAGQFMRFGALLYYCSVTGAAGAATWNTITLVPIM